MRPSPSSRSPALAARFLPPLAAVAALLAHASQQVDAHAAAETAYLAILAAVLLSAVAVLEGPAGGTLPLDRGSVGATAAVLVVLAAWVLPAGPLRGGVVIALGLAAVVVTAGRRLVGGSPPSPAAAVPAPSPASLFALTLPLALVAQSLVRADRLLAPEPDWRFLAGLLGLPLAAAAAGALLAARAGRAPALTAVATAALLGPGFTTLTTGGLVVLAAAVVAWRPDGGAGAQRRRPVAMTVVVAVSGALAVVEPVAGVLAALVGLAIGGLPAASLAVGASAVVALAFLPVATGWQGDLALATTTVAPLALVVTLALAIDGARRWAGAAIAVALLAVVAARSGVGLPLLALPCAALPLLCGRALAERSPAGRHLLFVPQVVWSVALLVATVLAAAYPWLRAEPLASVLGLLGLAADWWSPAMVGAAAAVAVALEVASRRGLSRVISAEPPAPSPQRAAGLVTALLFVAAFVASPSAHRRVVLPSPVALAVERPLLELVLGDRDAADGRLVVTADTSLSHAVGVADSVPVATFRLVSDGTGPPAAPRRASEAGIVEERALRAGRDTAEWAIRRPDVAAAAAHPAPQPWVARVTEEGFFGLVFRSRVELPAVPAGARLVVERHPSLPVETIVHLHRVEVGP